MFKNTRNTRLFFPFLLIIALFCSCQQNESTANKSVTAKVDLEKLLGKWQSVENAKTVIELTQTRMFSYYDGLKLADESLMIYHNCVAWCLPEGRTEMPCMISDGKRAENCFEIVELTDKTLTYALMGKERKVFKFQKI